jgi:hypothetical protein
MISGGRTARAVPCQLRHPNARQEGYALLLIIFFTTVLLLTAAAATPRILLQGRREKEEEMIWRGKQYERGIRLFYMKNHRLPNSIEELTQSNGAARFMRRAYKDPLNQADGSWRLIYVGPLGELIVSTRPGDFFKIGVPGGIRSSSPAGSTQNASATGAQLTSAASPSEQNSGQIAPQGDVFGGKIIGVGSKIDQRSIIWWDGAKNYLQFEFVWDPSKYGMGVNPARLVNDVPQAEQSQTDAPARFPNALRNPSEAPANVPPNP